MQKTLEQAVAATRQELIEIGRKVKAGDIPRDGGIWDGHSDLVISASPRTHRSDFFFEQPRWVQTSWPRELSWVYREVRNAFRSNYLIDGCTRIEFLGRLSNTTNRYLASRNGRDDDGLELYLVVIGDAHRILDDMQSGSFRALEIAMGNSIVDDYAPKPDAGEEFKSEAIHGFIEVMERTYAS